MSPELSSSGLIGSQVAGMHHVGVTVRSLSESSASFKRLFGVEPFLTAEASGSDLGEAVRLSDPRYRIAYLRFPNAIVELVEYDEPRGSETRRQLPDVGTTHLCIEVSDIETTYETLVDAGIDCYSRPQWSTTGPTAGTAWLYFETPDGILMELLQPPVSPSNTGTPSAEG
jgi:catechol 2,3-dioxygenase-like lactoylglutathione lyase family enzyme